MGLRDALFDDEDNFLGRDFKSWAKILGFYAVYYSFLGVLFYGFTITFYLESRVLGSNPVGGKPAVANPRLDMPGAVVHPFKELMEDGDINRFAMSKDFIRSSYCAEMDGFFQNKANLNEESIDCSEKKTSEGTCKVDLKITKAGEDLQLLDKDFDFASCEKTTIEKMPMFAIDINKIIGWTPNNVGIHFRCYEYDGKSGAEISSDFEFKWLSSPSISADYFPFNGVSSEQLVQLPIDNRGPTGDRAEPCDTSYCRKNKPYNKPFVGGIVVGEFEKNKEHFFRCDVLSDKITRQLEVEVKSRPGRHGSTSHFLTPQGKINHALNADLRKLGIGFVEFGYMYNY